MTDQEKVEWLLRNLFLPNHRATLVRQGRPSIDRNGKEKKPIKLCTPCIDPIADNEFWRGHLLSYVKGEELWIRSLVEGECQLRLGIGLGVHYGGSKCPLGPHLTQIWGIDCDIDPEKDYEREAKRATDALNLFMACDLAKHAVVFVRGARWHAHGRLEKPVDAFMLKDFIKSHIPMIKVEVFPKSATEEAEWGSYLRLPFGSSNYDFMSEPKDILPLDWTLIPNISLRSVSGNSVCICTGKEEKGEECVQTLGLSIDNFETIRNIVQRHDLQRYVDGLFIADLPKNSQSEFDWRFLTELKTLGYGPEIFREAILFRNPDKEKITKNNEAYIKRTIRSIVLKKTCKEKHYSTQGKPIKDNDMGQQWLSNSPLIWSHFNAGRACCKNYFVHLTMACKQYPEWDLEGWSPTYFLDQKTMKAVNCGSPQTISKSIQMLRLMGFLRVTRRGSWKLRKVTHFKIRYPKQDEERRINQIIKVIKNSTHNYLWEHGFNRVRTEINKQVPNANVSDELNP